MAIEYATAENLDKLLDTDYAIVDFYGNMCGACVVLEPILNEASNDYGFIRFIKTNVHEEKELGERFGIRGVPTMKFFRGGVCVHETGGWMERDMLDKNIAVLLYGYPAPKLGE